jgi:hypothetical protein
VSLWPASHALVDEHFAGRASALSERRMWRHLPGCERCQARYRARTLLESLETDADRRARDRLGRALFVAARPRRVVLGVALVAAAALVLMVALPRNQFSPRGGEVESQVPHATLSIVRLLPGGTPERVGSVVHAGDSLAFTYLNPPAVAATHLMVFALTDAGQVFWFWPAWRDPTSDPAALPIASGEAAQELAEAVRHPLGPGPLTVHALFARRPYHVHEIEAAVAAHRLDALDGTLVTQRLEVLP